MLVLKKKWRVLRKQCIVRWPFLRLGVERWNNSKCKQMNEKSENSQSNAKQQTTLSANKPWAVFVAASFVVYFFMCYIRLFQFAASRCHFIDVFVWEYFTQADGLLKLAVVVVIAILSVWYNAWTANSSSRWFILYIHVLHCKVNCESNDCNGWKSCRVIWLIGKLFGFYRKWIWFHWWRSVFQWYERRKMEANVSACSSLNSMHC